MSARIPTWQERFAKVSNFKPEKIETFIAGTIAAERHNAMLAEIAELRSALQAQQGEATDWKWVKSENGKLSVQFGHELKQGEAEPPQISDDLASSIAPRPLDHPIDAYWKAPSGVGPLAKQWENKPNRLIYDLIAALMQQSEAKSPATATLIDADPAVAIVEHVYQHVGFKERDALVAEVRALLAAAGNNQA